MLVLTGQRLKGRAIAGLGLATHYCSSSLLPGLRQELACCSPGQVPGLLDTFTQKSGGRGQEEVQELEAAWQEVCCPGDLEATMAR